MIVGQGKKQGYLGDQLFKYHAGKYLMLFLPMPFEAEIIEASEVSPRLMAWIKVDALKIANLLSKVDRIAESLTIAEEKSFSGVLTCGLNDRLLDSLNNLFGYFVDEDPPLADLHQQTRKCSPLARPT